MRRVTARLKPCLDNGLNLAGVDPYMQRIALGGVLLLAMLTDQAGKSQGGQATR